MTYKKLLSQTVVAGAFSFAMASAQAGIVYSGTPSPSLSPVFGTLIDFDDKATGTLVGASDYAYLGVSSVTETEGLGTFARYAGSQSLPNYIGTGVGGERGTDAALGWDGTILFEFSGLASMVGIGIADSLGRAEQLRIFDSAFNLLDIFVAPTASNQYVVFDQGIYNIKYLEVTGDFFALDDLQHNAPIPEPETYAMLLAGLGLMGFVARRRQRKLAAA